MSRSAKNLARRVGATALCVAALMALPVAAQAGPVFITSALPASVSGEQVGEGPVTFLLDGQKWSCSSFTHSGTISTEALEALTVTPAVKECKLAGIVATVELKECTFVLHGEEEVGEAEFSGTEDISCPGGQVIKVSAGTCVAEIGGQNGLSKVAYKSELSETEPSTFKTTGEVTGLKYKTTDGFLCPFSGSGEKSNGEITGAALFTATNEEVEEASVALSDAWIDPLVLLFNAAKQTMVGNWKIKTAGKFKIWGQELKNGVAFEWVKKANTGGCAGEFVVDAGKVKECPFEIKTSGMAGKGAESEVITVWSPAAKVGQPLKSWTRWPSK